MELLVSSPMLLACFKTAVERDPILSYLLSMAKPHYRLTLRIVVAAGARR